MTCVFLSYRRDDTGADARRIHDRLVEKFGQGRVYLDSEDIPFGVDFVEHLTLALRTAAYVLVAIGPRWLLVRDSDGRRRLDDPKDIVRYEVRTALAHDRLVVPVVLGGATMPTERELPKELAPLVRRNGIALRPEPDFEVDLAVLIEGLHLDRIDAAHVPRTFRVGMMAANLARGGMVGWGLLGLILGGLTTGKAGVLGLIGCLLAGLLAGLAGGYAVGGLSGLLLRPYAPPLVARDVRHMGSGWSLATTGTVILGAVMGWTAAKQAMDEVVTSSIASAGGGIGGLLAGIFGALALGMFIAVLIMMLALFVGLVGGAGLTATYFARRLRIRAELLSRSRVVGLWFVWLFGALISGAVFTALVVITLNGART